MDTGAIAVSIAAVVIAVVYVSYLIVKLALQHEEKKLAVKFGADQRVDRILAETQAEMARLRERVQVLERLATDEDRRVASEISRLGDSAAVRG
jgi:hypothetical protein